MRLQPPPQPIKHVELAVSVTAGRCGASVFVGNRRAVAADRALVAHSATFDLPTDPKSLEDVLDLLHTGLVALAEQPDLFSA